MTVTNLLFFLILGGGLTTVLTAQFVTLQHLMSPGKRPMKELIALPFMWGAIVGTIMGVFDVVRKPQVIHKPAIARYRDSRMGSAPK